MGVFWDRQVKKVCFLLMFAFAAAALACNIILDVYRARMNRDYTNAFAAVFGNVREYYPDVPEEALIRLLNDRENADQGRLLLAQYGIFSEYGDKTFGGQVRRSTGLSILFNLVLFCLAAAVAGIVLVFLRRRKREITRLCGYMDEIAGGNDSLEIDNNGEDELSGLRNEIYKLTVFWKEQAENSRTNKKALADSVADISHQLKTPLTSVLVLTDNLLENEDMDVFTRQRFLTEIQVQLNGMGWLVTTMLKLSRLDAGVVELEQKKVFLRELAEKVLQKVELPAEWRQVSLRMQIGEKIWIEGDAGWLAEALINLVKNAIEHSAAGSVVEITAEENDVYTLLGVRDSGEGIDREEQKKLFERFYRGRNAAADSAGIGLSLAKKIVERQGGYISVESSEKGTVFLIKFLKCH